MTKNIFLLLFSALVFVQCAKKNADMASSKTQSPNTNGLFRNTAPAAAPARPINIGAYSSFDLDNGLKVIVVENHRLPVVSYQLSLLNSTVKEGDLSGYSSLAGDLLTKGTSTRTKAQIDEEVDFLGASLSASSSGMFASSLKKHSSKLLDLMSDVLYNPAFPESEFDKQKSLTISNLQAGKAEPNFIAGNIRRVVNYTTDHPYGDITSEKTLNNISIDNLKDYYTKYFIPNNAYLIVVGDITPDEAKLQVQKYFSQWKKGTVPTQNFATPTPPTGNRVIIGHKDGAKQSLINISYPVDLKPDDKDILAGTAMNSVLGGGIFSGRLMQNLREKKGYTYGAGSSLSSNELIGNFNASANVGTNVTDSALVEFIKEMKGMKTNPPTMETLQLVKNSLTGSFGRSLESPQTIANFARNIYKNNLPKDYYDTYLKRVDALTLADLDKAVDRFIRPEGANIIIVGNKDEIAEKLMPFDADGEIEYYDAFGYKIEMKKDAIPDGLTGANIIEDYLSSIGGKSQIAKVKSIISKGEMALGGQKITMTTKVNQPSQASIVMSMNGMNVSEQVINGDVAKVSQMGNGQTIKKGQEGFDDFQEMTVLFPQVNYLQADYKVELKGTEEVDGSPCYKLVVTKPNGNTITEFYDIKTKYLMRSVSNRKMGPNEVTQITTYGDYKVIDGVTFPFKTVIEGMMPMPLSVITSEVKINVPMTTADFKVE
jgi:predicted Zn-dependent peptidase